MIKPEPYIVEKIIVENNILEQAVPVHIERAVPCVKEVPVAVQVPTAVVAVKEIPRNMIQERLVEVRTFIDNNK